MEQTINTLDTSYSSKEHHAEKKRPVLEVNLTCVWFHLYKNDKYYKNGEQIGGHQELKRR